MPPFSLQPGSAFLLFVRKTQVQCRSVFAADSVFGAELIGEDGYHRNTHPGFLKLCSADAGS